MSVIDQIVSWFAPASAYKRERARAALEVMREARSEYAGALKSRQGKFKKARQTPPLGGSAADVARVRAAVRDLVRNDPIARRGIDAVVAKTIGRGIMPRVVGPDGEEDDAYKGFVEEHLLTTALDASGQSNLFGIQSLVFRAVVEGGECLIRRRPRMARDKLPLPFQLEVLEAEFIDSGVDGPQTNGNYAVKGVEFDRLGRRVAYHLYAEHPNDATGFASLRHFKSRSARVDARNIAHVYRMDRPGQQRGVPWLAPVVVRLGENSEAIDSWLLKMKMAAQFMAFVRTEQNMNEFMDHEQVVDDDGQTVQFLEAGTIQRLGAGENVEFPDLPRADGADGFQMNVKRDVAATLGITYEDISGDYSNTNFSSGRMGWIQTGLSVDNWHANILKPQLLNVIAGWFFEAAAPFVGDRGARIKWVPPRRESVDPVKDALGDRRRLSDGLTSRRRILAERGEDVAEVDQERAEDRTREKELGLFIEEETLSESEGTN